MKTPENGLDWNENTSNTTKIYAFCQTYTYTQIVIFK